MWCLIKRFSFLDIIMLWIRNVKITMTLDYRRPRIKGFWSIIKFLLSKECISSVENMRMKRDNCLLFHRKLFFIKNFIKELNVSKKLIYPLNFFLIWYTRLSFFKAVPILSVAYCPYLKRAYNDVSAHLSSRYMYYRIIEIKSRIYR